MMVVGVMAVGDDGGGGVRWVGGGARWLVVVMVLGVVQSIVAEDDRPTSRHIDLDIHLYI